MLHRFTRAAARARFPSSRGTVAPAGSALTWKMSSAADSFAHGEHATYMEAMHAVCVRAQGWMGRACVRAWWGDVHPSGDSVLALPSWQGVGWVVVCVSGRAGRRLSRADVPFKRVSESHS